MRLYIFSQVTRVFRSKLFKMYNCSLFHCKQKAILKCKNLIARDLDRPLVATVYMHFDCIHLLILHR